MKKNIPYIWFTDTGWPWAQYKDVALPVLVWWHLYIESSPVSHTQFSPKMQTPHTLPEWVKYGVSLTHLPLVPHVCVREQGQHWFRYWLVTCSVPSHYLHQCWLIVNWTLGNKLQWNFHKKEKVSFKKIKLKILSAKWQLYCPGGE